MLLSKLISIEENIIGKKLKDFIDFSLVEKKGNKGIIGHVFETQVFGKKLDNKAEPDLNITVDQYHRELLEYLNSDVSIELKVTAAKQLKNGEYRAKERLKLTKIQYNHPYPDNFIESSLYSKIKLMLIIYYLYTPDAQIEDYTILTSFINNLDNHDLSIIERDYEIIISKIRNGEAHLLSGSDTFYLEACTSGANNIADQKQPNSSVMAKNRSFAFKNAYMSNLLNNSLNNSDIIIHNSKNDLDYIENKLKPFIGMTFEDMKKHVNYNGESKSNKALLIRKILGLTSNNFEDLPLFKKANIKFKSFNVSNTGCPSDGVNFVSRIDFDDICNTSWEDSKLHEVLNTMYFYCVFQKDKKTNQLTFIGYKFLGFNEDELQQAKHDWEQVKMIALSSDNIVRDLPKMSGGGLFYTRTKGANKEKSLRTLNNGQTIPGLAWWLNNTWIKENIVKDLL